MDYKTIEEVYTANDNIRKRLLQVVTNLTTEQVDLPTENGAWTVQGVVEHVSKVDAGMTGILSRLLLKAEEDGKISDGSIKFSSGFMEAISKSQKAKFEAPDVVVPDGTHSVSDSLRLMRKSRARLMELRSKFEALDAGEYTFPHPYFGEMNAYDWLALLGFHEFRHTNQIEKILATHDGS